MTKDEDEAFRVIQRRTQTEGLTNIAVDLQQTNTALKAEVERLNAEAKLRGYVGIQHDFDKACAEVERLREALRKLSAEVSAMLGLAEADLRAIIGNTNVNVLTLRWEEAKAALADKGGAR
jgi:hypothetical protein